MRQHDPYYDKKVFHYAAHIAADGSVSALCYQHPHAIDLTKGQSWVLDADRVTCPRCQRLLKPRQ